MTQASVIVPSDLMTYKPTRDTYAISWRINPAVGESIGNFDCEVQMDIVDTFNSSNLRHLVKTSNNILNYQNGYFFKAFVFKAMEVFEDVSFYYRVRVNSLDYLSDWSDSLLFNLSKVTWYNDMQMLYGLMPDDSIYAKEGITQTLKIVELWAREIQDFKRETDCVSEGINFYKLQDSSLYDTLGKLMEYERNIARPVIEYRRELLELWNAYLYGGTEGALKRFIKAILGLDPSLDYIRNRYGWIIRSTQDLDVPYGSSYVQPENPFTDASLYYRLRDIAALASSLEGYWKMYDDTNSTQVVDSGTNSYHGTLMGGKNTEDISEAGVIDKCLHLDGAADYVDCGNVLNPGLGNFSMNAWIKMDDNTIFPIIIKNSSYSHYLGLSVVSGKVYVNLGYSGWPTSHFCAVTGTTVLNNDQWYMITAVIDRTNTYVDLYVNGVKETLSSTSYALADLESVSNSGRLLIGKSAGYINYFADGSISDIMFFMNALPSSDISTLYNEGDGLSSDALTLTPTPQPNSKWSKALGLNLTVYNAFNLTTRHALIESFVSKIKPANVTVYISYVAPETSLVAWGTDYWGGGLYWGQTSTIWKPYIPVN